MCRKARLSGSSQCWNMFRTMRNKVTTMLRTSKQSFFNRNVNAFNKNSSGKQWNTWELVSPQYTLFHWMVMKQSQTRTSCLCLNAYFSDCFNKSLPPLGLNDPDVSPETTLSEVYPNTSKSSDPDRISGKRLKTTAPSIAAPVTKLKYLAISTGIKLETLLMQLYLSPNLSLTRATL